MENLERVVVYDTPLRMRVQVLSIIFNNLSLLCAIFHGTTNISLTVHANKTSSAIS